MHFISFNQTMSIYKDFFKGNLEDVLSVVFMIPFFMIYI